MSQRIVRVSLIRQADGTLAPQYDAIGFTGAACRDAVDRLRGDAAVIAAADKPELYVEAPAATETQQAAGSA